MGFGWFWKKARPDGDTDLRAALDRVLLPGGGTLAASPALTALRRRDDGSVLAVLTVDPQDLQTWEKLASAAESALRAVPGVRGASVVLTSERPPAQGQGEERLRPPPPEKASLPQFRRIVAVASGKGGVGKSTVAISLAAALSRAGYRVGVLDADIHGPSLPRLTGLVGQRAPAGTRLKLCPLEAQGLTLMSMGFLIAEDAPVVWRGPMVQGAILQMISDVEWPDLDILLIDMPPGTGDAQLAIAQKLPLSGAVIVSTPQDVALADVRKGIEAFRKMNVPVLGMVENMSGFVCPHCHECTDIFGSGGAARMAEELSVPLLGEVPIDPAIRKASDEGRPVAGAIGELWDQIAGRLMSGLDPVAVTQNRVG